MSVNTHFDKLYCINLPRRPDRLSHVKEQFSKYNLNVTIFPAVDGREEKHKYSTPLNAGELGVILSNIEILTKAKENKYATIAIMEDDIYFSDEINNIDEYIASLPEDWHVFYLSSNQNVHQRDVMPPVRINDKVLKLHHSYAAHFVAIKEEMYDVILNEIKALNVPYDVSLMHLQSRFNFYSFTSPNGVIATQIVSLSETTGNVEDYQWLIK